MDLKFYNIYKFHVKNFVSQILRHIRQIQIEDTKYFPSIAMIVIAINIINAMFEIYEIFRNFHLIFFSIVLKNKIN